MSSRSRGCSIRRHRDFLKLALVAMLGVAAVGTPAAAKSPSCDRTGRTLAANGQARVYKANVNHDGYRVFACLRRPHRTVYLGRHEFLDVGVTTVRLNGTSVAYERLACNRTDCTGGIRVRNLRTRVVRSSPIPVGAGAATQIVVSPGGAAAWTRLVKTSAVEVRALGSGGERLLDSGTDVDAKSLALGGSTIYWTKAGTAQSAPLPASGR